MDEVSRTMPAQISEETALACDKAICTKPLRGGRLRVFAGGFLTQIKISSRRRQRTINIQTMLNIWVQGKLRSWRGLADEVAKRPLKTHTIYL
jgi:hypothetical protein